MRWLHMESERYEQGHCHSRTQPGRRPQQQAADRAYAKNEQSQRRKNLREILQKFHSMIVVIRWANYRDGAAQPLLLCSEIISTGVARLLAKAVSVDSSW